MTTIIRIEHPRDGKGLWHSEDIDDYRILCELTCYANIRLKHNGFPTPKEDGQLQQKNEYCSFKSIEQLQQWLEPEWMKEILSVGFKVYMIDVSECITLPHQILFKKENILQQKDISSLFS